MSSPSDPQPPPSCLLGPGLSRNCDCGEISRSAAPRPAPHRLWPRTNKTFRTNLQMEFNPPPLPPTSDSVVSSWKICPSPSTWRTQILQARSTVALEKRSRVKQQWRFLWEPSHTCWKGSSCTNRQIVEVRVKTRKKFEFVV